MAAQRRRSGRWPAQRPLRLPAHRPPVTMTTRRPIECNVAIQSAASGRGGSLKAISPITCSVGAVPIATPSTRNPSASISDAFALAVGDGCAMAMTQARAPLTTQRVTPLSVITVASAIFVFGSKGMNCSRLGIIVKDAWEAAACTAASTGSSPPSELASRAHIRTSDSWWPSSGTTAATVSSLLVNVPVLSTHSTFTEAASSTADNRVGRTPHFPSVCAPITVAKVNVAGSATGTDARIAIRERLAISPFAACS